MMMMMTRIKLPRSEQLVQFGLEGGGRGEEAGRSVEETVDSPCTGTLVQGQHAGILAAFAEVQVQHAEIREALLEFKWTLHAEI
eukprot:4007-Rhodomonas_salina.1